MTRPPVVSLRGITHSFGAVLVVMGIAAVATPRRASWSAGQWRAAIAAGAAYASHLLLDSLGTDTSPPIGIMALWPLGADFYKVPVALFPPVPREVWSATFWTGVPIAVATEVCILAPLAFLVARVPWMRRRVELTADR